MSPERPIFTPDEQSKMAERTLSDAELIKGGAKYNENGILQPEEEQIKNAHLEMENELYKQTPEYQEEVSIHQIIGQLNQLLEKPVRSSEDNDNLDGILKPIGTDIRTFPKYLLQGDNIGLLSVIIREAKTPCNLCVGQRISVQRSDGTIETDWVVGIRNEQDGLIEVHNTNQKIKKIVPLWQLVVLNLDLFK